MVFRKTLGDRVFDLIIWIFVVTVLIITLYPLIYVISMAISDPYAAARGEVWLFPKGIDFSAMKTVLNDSDLFTYYYNSIWYAVVGTVTGIITTALAAYPLSRPEFKLRGPVMKFIMFTMFFSGGTIPTYLVVAKHLHLYNSRLALILPVLTSAWYITVARSFFESLPDEIVESARIDGASEYRIFGQLVLPLSKPILAVLGLYYSVSQWNSYFPALLYLGEKRLQPLALYVRSVVIQNSITSAMESAIEMSAAAMLSTLQIKYAVVLVAVLPMLLIYPFLAGNLEKGLMVGAIKA